MKTWSHTAKLLARSLQARSFHLPSLSRLFASQKPGFAKVDASCTQNLLLSPGPQLLSPSSQWLWNNHLQRSFRSTEVDLHALGEVASKLVAAERCIEITRLPEGSTKHLLLLKFDNSRELIARLPTRLVGNTHLSTASEVATIDFCREILNQPVPRILGWSSSAELISKVGSDFILMENLDGQNLKSLWNTGSSEEIAPIYGDLLSVSINMSNKHYPAIGSIYFKEDVPQSFPNKTFHFDGSSPLGKYRIGPIVDPQFWFNGELSALELCGPWDSMTSFLRDACRLGLRRAEAQFERADIPGSSASISQSRPTDMPAIRQTMEDALTLCPHLEEMSGPPNLGLISPILFHPNLDLSNIMVSSRTPSREIGSCTFIDWQGASVVPFNIAARVPPVVEHVRKFIPRSYALWEDEPPSLPDGVPEAKMEEAKFELRLEKRRYFYMKTTAKYTPRFQLPYYGEHERILQALVRTVLRVWADGYLPLQELVNLVIRDSKWTESMPCPIVRTEAEIAKQLEESEEHRRYKAWVKYELENLGCTTDGLPIHGDIERARKEAWMLKWQWDDEEMGGPFPFEDGRPSVTIT